MRYFTFCLIVLNLLWLPTTVKARTDCPSQTDIPEQECDVLMDIFNNTAGLGWFDLFDNGWMIIQAPCSWIGIVCSDGHVIQIDRTKKGLDGTLPDLTNLTQLEVLKLADNKITGTIDAAKLPLSLQELYLSNNRLTEIPDLSTLPNLVTVDLDFPLTVNKSGQGTVTSSPVGISCGSDCTFSYSYRTSVTLSATPAANFFFVDWTGACSGTDTCQMIMNKPQIVTATFDDIPPNTLTVTTQGNGSVTSSPAGIDCGTDCTKEYIKNTPVILTAHPESDSVFVKWTGACPDTTNPSCQVTMSQDQNVTATFELIPPNTLTVTTQGNGTVTSSPVGIDCGTDCEYQYSSDTSVTLTADPDTNNSFVEWTGGGCTGTTPSCQVNMSQAQNVTATFELILPPTSYTLTVTIQGNGSVTTSSPAGIECGTDCEYQYSSGNSVTLTATPAADSQFAGWGGACTNMTPSCQVTMTQAQNVTATFELIPPNTLTVTTEGNGTVTSSPAGIDCGTNCEAQYNSGTSVTLTAVPEKNNRFVEWTSACPDTTNPSCQVTMSQDQNVTATFELIPPNTLTVTTQGNGTVTSSPAGIDCGTNCEAQYNSGTSVTLTAAPDANNRFVEWTGDGCTGTDLSCQVIMNQARNVTATFELIPTTSYTLTLTTQGNGSVTSEPVGIDCGINCEAQYNSGISVTLTAAPDANNRVKWTGGGCTGTTPSCQVTMSQDQNVTATFYPPTSNTLTVTTQGNGSVTSSPAGIDCGTDCEYQYSSDTSVTLTADPEKNNRFVQWTGGGCTGTDLSCQVTMTQAQNVTATFEVIPTTSYTLTLTTQGNGTVTSLPTGIDCGTNCEAQYNSGISVTLTAAPETNNRFVEWTGGGCTGTTPSCQVTMNQARNVTATFKLIAEYVLTVSTLGDGNGTIIGLSNDCQDVCTESVVENTAMKLTAKPASGSIFAGWQGAGCTGTDSCTVPMNAPQNVAATFNRLPPNEFALTVNITGTGNGRVIATGIDCGSDCSEQYVEQSLVTLTATPLANSMFSGWSGACTGIATECQVTMTQAQNVTATFSLENYRLTISQPGSGNGNVTGPGIDCGDDCWEDYQAETQVILSATPATDSQFAGWTGACQGISLDCQVAMTQAQNVTATFHLKRYPLIVNQEGEGSGIVTADGIRCGNDCTEEYEINTLITLTATPEAGVIFSGWSGACTGTADCQVTMNRARNVTAIFDLSNNTLTITTQGNGTVTSSPAGIECGTDCEAQYSPDTSVTLTAHPDTDYTFTGWVGAGCFGTAPCTVAMNSPQSVSASFNFNPLAHLLTVSTNGEGSGRITTSGIDCGNDCGEEYQENTTVTLVANPSANSTWAAWGGACEGVTGSVCQVTMNQAQNATATFHLKNYRLTLSQWGRGTGNVTGPGIDCGDDCLEDYQAENQVTLTATPAADSQFAGWGGACTNMTPSCQVTMSQAQNLTATFHPKRYPLTVNKVGEGSGLVTATGIYCGNDCTEEYEINTPITLTATPAVGVLLIGWSGGTCEGNGLMCQITMSQAHEVTATFELIPPRLLTVQTDGNGTVTSFPAGIDCGTDCEESYRLNTLVMLTAQPDTDALLDSWSGACQGNSLDCPVTMTEAQNVTATFTQKTYRLSVSQKGLGSGYVTGDGIACGNDCTEDYQAQTPITLTAQPADGSQLVGWSGACSGNSASCQVTMNQAQQVTALFDLGSQPQLLTVQTHGEGIVTSVPMGIDCGTDCEESYNLNTLVMLTAQPDTGWSGACQGVSLECQVTMTKAQNVTATFTPKTYHLSVSQKGLGSGQITGDGIACGSDCTEDYSAQTVVTLAAAPAADSVFVGWSGACSGTAACQVTMTAAQSVTATFNRLPPNEFALTVNQTGTGNGQVTGTGIDCGSDCSEQFFEDTEVTLTATPSADSTFAGFSGAACNGTDVCQLTMNQAHNLTATFDLIVHPEYVLTVNTQGDGNGTVIGLSNDCQDECTESMVENTAVMLTAQPDPGSIFAGWQGADCAGTGSCTILMNAPQNISATFNRIPPQQVALTVNQAGTGHGSIVGEGIDCGQDCSEQYVEQSVVSLTAAPLADSIFSGWSGACTGTAACQVTMNADQLVVATFNRIEYKLVVSNAGTGSGHVSGTGIYCGSDCVESYWKDTLVTLTAAPAAGSKFEGWQGACTGIQDCTVSMTAAQNVEAVFNLKPLAEYELTVSQTGTGRGYITGNGIDCGNDCRQRSVENTSVVLTAKPAEGSAFVGWQGADCTGTGRCLVSMTAAQLVTAAFELIPANNYSLTISRLGDGRITGEGIDCGNDCTATYLENTVVTLTATHLDDAMFVGWAEACSGTAPTCEVTLNQAQNLTAQFESIEKVTIDSEPPSQDILVGDTFELVFQIVAESQKVDSAVLEWQFDANLLQFIDLTLGKTLEQPVTLPPSQCDNDPGCRALSVKSASPVSGTFDVATLTLQAKQAGNALIALSETTEVGFIGQSILKKPTESVTIVVTEPLPVAVEPVTLTIHRLGEGRITGLGIDCGDDCTASYDENTPVMLTATPLANATFLGWEGGCSGASPTCLVTVTQTQSLTARFGSPDKVSLYPVLADQEFLSVGETFDLVFKIAAGSQKVDSAVLAWQFDADLLEVVALSIGNALEQQLALPPSDCDNEPGCLTLSVTSAIPASGTFDVATLTLLAKQAGRAEIALTETTDVRFAGLSVLKPLLADNIVRVITELPTLTVNHIGTGGGTVTAPGIDCPTDCTEQYPFNKRVALVAIPRSDSVLVGWTGACAGAADSCQVSLGSSQSVTAIWAKSEPTADQHLLTISTAGSSGRGHIIGQGIDCVNECHYEYVTGSQLILTANAEAGSRFIGWRGACSESLVHCVVNLNQARTVTAVFERFSMLTVSSIGQGNVSGLGIDCGLDCSELYEFGAEVTLTATPAADFVFAGWAGACAETEECQLSLTTDINVTAQFQLKAANIDLVCPPRGLITIVCNAQGRTLTDVTLAPGASVSNAVLEGTIYNYGWLSNSIVQPDTQLIGGIVTGTLINHGLMKDFEFRGASVTGGTLAGYIINKSPIDGLFKDVQLAPNTHIRGGWLQGTIAGDSAEPAWLADLRVLDNSHLSGVLLSDTVQLGDNVEITDLLVDLSPPPDCHNNLFAEPKWLELSNGVFESSDSLLEHINALSEFQEKYWVVTQNAYQGYLQLTLDVRRFAVQPMSVNSTERQPELELLEQQQVRFLTDEGIAIFAQPAVQSPCTLKMGLVEWSLPRAIQQSNGHLRLSVTPEYGYSARPSWVATELEETDEATPGLFFMESEHLTDFWVAYLVFVDEEGIARQQVFYPAVAMPAVLYSQAKHLVVTDDGWVSFSWNGKAYYGMLDYLVVNGEPSLDGRLQVKPVSDVNGDRKDDWLLIYPSGERQVLFRAISQ